MAWLRLKPHYLLNKVEYGVFAVVYFFTEVPLLLAAVAVHRVCKAPSMAKPGGADAYGAQVITLTAPFERSRTTQHVGL